MILRSVLGDFSLYGLTDVLCCQGQGQMIEGCRDVPSVSFFLQHDLDNLQKTERSKSEL